MKPSSFRCAVCGRGLHDPTPDPALVLYRTSPRGVVPPVWACQRHAGVAVDAIVDSLVGNPAPIVEKPK